MNSDDKFGAVVVICSMIFSTCTMFCIYKFKCMELQLSTTRQVQP